MKGIIVFIMIGICFLLSCKKKEAILQLPVDRFYIVDWSSHHPYYPEDSIGSIIVGYSELTNDFRLQLNQKLYGQGNTYFISEWVIPDSIKNQISNTIRNYQRDTVYADPKSKNTQYVKENHIYFFIIRQTNGQSTTIRFKPEALPDDLFFLYSYLYENRRPIVDSASFNELFLEFDTCAISHSKVYIASPNLSRPKFRPPIIK